jgi:chemotaxis protein MotA
MARLYRFSRGDLTPTASSPFFGFMVAGSAIALGALLSGNVARLFDIPSLLIVVGGTIGATLVQCSFAEWKAAMIIAFRTLTEKSETTEERLHRLMQLCQIVRKEGILALERLSLTCDDPIFQKGCELAADGTSPEEIKRIVANDAASTLVPLRAAEKVLSSMGEYAPGLGLVGTLLGLVQMLGSLENPAAVGSAMAVALLTTLYGAVVSYLVFFPLAARVARECEMTNIRNQLTVEGIARIASQENSLMIEQRLKSFLVNG